MIESLIPGSDFSHWSLNWQMTRCEKAALIHLLASLRPFKGLEIGTYRGGSLQVLSHFCNTVDAIDLNPAIVGELGGGLFPNVCFHIGESSSLLPGILRESAAAGDPVGFVLIDGDHSADGVRRDINALLSVQPQAEMIVLMHDAFNPDCRRGILAAGWQECPYVHEVEIDFIPGVYHQSSFDTAAARTMWGGFACAVLRPEPRRAQLRISQQQQGLFEAVLLQSSHMPAKLNLLKRIKQRINPLLLGCSR